MHIESVSIENYKGFLDRQTLRFEPGFNLLVGANNAGKTTVLDVLDLPTGINEPHRSQRTIPVYGGSPDGQSTYAVGVAVCFQELRQMVGWNQVFLPLAVHSEDVRGRLEAISTTLLEFASRDEPIRFLCSFDPQGLTAEVDGGEFIKGIADSRQGHEGLLVAEFTYAQPNAAPALRIVNQVSGGPLIAGYAQQFRQRIYRFSARRQPGTDFGTAISPTLDREATSLPYCINHLNSNDSDGHRLLCEWVSRIFPSVKWIQAPPTGAGTFQIRCLPQLPDARREDLATPLSRMGTGIGNIIAMLYVVLTARAPQVIAIDEPNAFLHPRALRELLAILESEGKQHQFILTGHSPDVLTAVNARTISLLEFDGVATSVRQVGPKDLHALRGGLADLGIRVTDLHAKDRVLWVEGASEELVMPSLLRFACPEIAAGTAVLRVERTGTFSTKGVKPQEVAQLYERLSTSSAFVPPMVCILLDAERRSEEERSELERSSQGKLRFLDRRMLENFLLDAEAIAAVLVELGEPVTPEAVESAIAESLVPIQTPAELVHMDGAALITALFSTLSEVRHEFRKTRDVPALVEYLIANRPERLAPLRDCLRKTCGLPSLESRPAP